MNQQCKVCGEPAAGFHFGAFTCEGCKSFFGRSYNNLSSISECKNNGECIINKKNRTACKACRLRKCLMVGMSKSGSRYGRRSNWFKIHCLLQEQQQAAQQHQQQHQQHQGQGPHQKPPPPPPVGMHPGMFHGASPYGLYARPPCTKEELMLLGLEEYSKHPASASPSVSSPDSHNSDSSNEINDRRNALLRQGKSLHHDSGLGKDLFLPLPFGGLPLMPPPGFLPSSHLMFPGFHPALYSHPQAGLLKPADGPHLTLPSSPLANNNNNSRFTPNHNTEPNPHHTLAAGGGGPGGPGGTGGDGRGSDSGKSPDSYSKRYILDQVLESQRCPSNGTVSSDKDEPEPEEVGPATMTPPRSPVVSVVSQPPSATSVARQPGHHQHQHHHHHNHQQDNPIDLSMKTGSSCTSVDDRRSSISGAESNGSDDEAATVTATVVDSRTPPGLDGYSKYAPAVATKTAPANNNNNIGNHQATSLTPSPTKQHLGSPPVHRSESPQHVVRQHHPPVHHPYHPQHLARRHHRHQALGHLHHHHHLHQQQQQRGSGSESDLEPDLETEYDREVNRMKLQGTTPLDLTTKV